MIEVHVRRFFCDNKRCQRAIFPERLPKVVACYARKTCRLDAALGLLALALGGEHGARVTRELAMARSPDTLLRLIRRLPVPVAGEAKVVGVDDWALCKGTRYGTILCDLEKHRLLDLLPEYTAEALKAWLSQHPTIRTLSRDRGSVLQRGATAGAHQARQVADRFHLLKNIQESLIRCLDRHSKDIHQAAAQVARERGPPAAEASTEFPAWPARLMASRTEEAAAAAARARREARYQQLLLLHREGKSQRKIARQLGLDRATVAKYLHAEKCPHRAARYGARSTDPFAGYLQQRWAEGCHNARQLARELAARGFTGSPYAVRRAVAPWRSGLPVEPRDTAPPPWQRKLVRASSRQAAWLLVKPPKKRSPEEDALVKAIVAQSPTRRPPRWFWS